MQREKLMRAMVAINRLRDSSERDHAIRIRSAKRAIDVLHDFIAHEVRAATHEAKDDPAHLTWEQAGKLLGISKSATYTRYGKSE